MPSLCETKEKSPPLAFGISNLKFQISDSWSLSAKTQSGKGWGAPWDGESEI
jgi:hypothetical protein